MRDERDNYIPMALYQAAAREVVLNYIEEIDPTAIEKAMESRAIRTLEAMRLILEDDRYTDPECFEVIDTLVMQFFKELEIAIDRHSEYD